MKGKSWMGDSTSRTDFVYLFLGIFLGTLGMVAFALSKFIGGALVVLITVAGLAGFILVIVLQARRLKNFKRLVGTFLASLLVVILATYAVLFTTIWLFQDVIANRYNAFFQPKSISEQAALALLGPQVEAIEMETPDGAWLRGWLVKYSPERKSPLVIFFDGSGSEVSQMIPYAQKLDGWSVALVNYRGFGLSEGTPSQAHAFADATLLFDTLAQRSDIDPNRIVAMGYSLGTGVAVYLSEHRATAGTVLVAPYDSLTIIGLKRPPIYAPLAGIMKRYFDSISRAPQIHSPLLSLVGSADQAVPAELSFKLVDQWGGPTTVKVYKGEDHGLLLQDNSSWKDIQAFLQEINGK
jgi:hypothetical protein